MEYPRRYLRTRGQLLFQIVVSAIVLQPFLMWRLLTEPLVVSIALGGLALVSLALGYQGWRFLTYQELRHSQPTPEMTFVFMLTAVYPLAMSTLLLILLAEM